MREGGREGMANGITRDGEGGGVQECKRKAHEWSLTCNVDFGEAVHVCCLAHVGTSKGRVSSDIYPCIQHAPSNAGV